MPARIADLVADDQMRRALARRRRAAPSPAKASSAGSDRTRRGPWSADGRHARRSRRSSWRWRAPLRQGWRVRPSNRNAAASMPPNCGMRDRADDPARREPRARRRDADQVEQAALGLMDHLGRRIVEPKSWMNEIADIVPIAPATARPAAVRRWRSVSTWRPSRLSEIRHLRAGFSPRRHRTRQRYDNSDENVVIFKSPAAT